MTTFVQVDSNCKLKTSYYFLFLFAEFNKFSEEVTKNQEIIIQKLDDLKSFFVSNEFGSTVPGPAQIASAVPDIVSSICFNKEDVMKLENALNDNSINKEHLVSNFFCNNALNIEHYSTIVVKLF